MAHKFGDFVEREQSADAQSFYFGSLNPKTEFREVLWGCEVVLICEAAFSKFWFTAIAFPPCKTQHAHVLSANSSNSCIRYSGDDPLIWAGLSAIILESSIQSDEGVIKSTTSLYICTREKSASNSKCSDLSVLCTD